MIQRLGSKQSYLKEISLLLIQGAVRCMAQYVCHTGKCAELTSLLSSWSQGMNSSSAISLSHLTSLKYIKFSLWLLFWLATSERKGRTWLKLPDHILWFREVGRSSSRNLKTGLPASLCSITSNRGTHSRPRKHSRH